MVLGVAAANGGGPYAQCLRAGVKKGNRQVDQREIKGRRNEKKQTATPSIPAGPDQLTRPKEWCVTKQRMTMTHAPSDTPAVECGRHHLAEQNFVASRGQQTYRTDGAKLYKMLEVQAALEENVAANTCPFELMFQSH